MDTLRRMRQTIREQRYRIGSRANDEMGDDSLLAADIENIILTGEIAQVFTHDPRGVRCEVLGATVDCRRAQVMCRLLLSGVLLIITAYVEEEE